MAPCIWSSRGHSQRASTQARRYGQLIASGGDDSKIGRSQSLNRDLIWRKRACGRLAADGEDGWMREREKGRRMGGSVNLRRGELGRHGASPDGARGEAVENQPWTVWPLP